MYIKGQLKQTFFSFGIKLPDHVVTACTSNSNIKVKIFKSMQKCSWLKTSYIKRLNLSLVSGVEFEMLFIIYLLHMRIVYTSNNGNKCIGIVWLALVPADDRRSSQHGPSHQGPSLRSCCLVACLISSGLGLNTSIAVASHGSRDYMRGQSKDW